MGTLYVVATPIGNLEDISLRASRVLLTTPVIACEDTRRTGQLINILESKKETPFEKRSLLKRVARRYLSIRDWNEVEMVSRVLAELQIKDVALVSDAGTPLISDPGFKVVRAAREAGFKIVPVPGANAAIAALSASGLPTNKFVFLGFLGKKWELYPGITNIVYESPIRAEKTIKAILERYPDVKIVIANEMTKIHERFLDYARNDNLLGSIKGEVTILVFLPEEIAADHGDRDGDV